jgi:hypothetical protein
MADRGNHAVHPALRLEKLCKYYPWSVLWVLAMTGVASLVAREYTPVAIVLVLAGVIGAHSFHQDRMTKRRR